MANINEMTDISGFVNQSCLDFSELGDIIQQNEAIYLDCFNQLGQDFLKCTVERQQTGIQGLLEIDHTYEPEAKFIDRLQFAVSGDPNGTYSYSQLLIDNPTLTACCFNVNAVHEFCFRFPTQGQSTFSRQFYVFCEGVILDSILVTNSFSHNVNQLICLENEINFNFYLGRYDCNDDIVLTYGPTVFSPAIEFSEIASTITTDAFQTINVQGSCI